MKRVIIDTDPGIDDAAALFLALASPELDVEAITTIYGNGPVDLCTSNARRILHAAGRLDIPVYQGAARPLLREPTPGWASAVHGADALGNTHLPLPDTTAPPVGERHAALEIIARVLAAPGDITLLALGRPTNLALAFALEPRLASAVAEIVVMGGTLTRPGNVSPVTTANLFEDPEAAAMLYRSGAPLVQVGLDVCDQVIIQAAQLAQIWAADTPITRLLAAATPCLQSYYHGRGLLSAPHTVQYNDLPAVAYAIDPTLFHAEAMYVTIETHSDTSRGQTIADRRRYSGQAPNAQVCLQVDVPRLTAMFAQRLVAYRG